MKRNTTPFRTIHNMGFTLVELMVGVLIAMLAMLLITEVYSNAVWRKRDISGSSEAQRTASMMLYRIANSLKQAGSIVANSHDTWGCKLQAAKSGTTLLPMPSALPFPFENLPKTLHLAPVIIKEASAISATSRESDIIMAISSGLESSGIAFVLQKKPDSGKLFFSNTNGLVANDLLLTTDTTSGACNITQIASDHETTYTDGELDSTPSLIKVSGAYAMTGALNTLDIQNKIYGLGQAPQFMVFGVNSKTQSLEAFDLLQLHGGNAPTPIGENVFLLRTLYGIDTDDDGAVDSWVSPTDSKWVFDELQKNTDAAREKLSQIKAVRIALVTRSSYPAATSTFQDELTLFSSVSPASLHQTVTLTENERHYRYQIYESIIPLFNTRNI